MIELPDNGGSTFLDQTLLYVIDKIEIGDDANQVGMVVFKEASAMVIELVEHQDAVRLKQSVLNGLYYNRSLIMGEGSDFAGEALRITRRDFFTEINDNDRDDNDFPDVILVIMNGRTSNDENAKIQALNLRRLGTTVVPVGVGAFFMTEEGLEMLDDMGGDGDDDYMAVSTYEDLADRTDHLMEILGCINCGYASDTGKWRTKIIINL